MSRWQVLVRAYSMVVVGSTEKPAVLLLLRLSVCHSLTATRLAVLRQQACICQHATTTNTLLPHHLFTTCCLASHQLLPSA